MRMLSNDAVAHYWRSSLSTKGRADAQAVVRRSGDVHVEAGGNISDIATVLRKIADDLEDADES